MKKLKMTLCIALTAVILWGRVETVSAITHVGNCGATAQKVTCGTYVGTASVGSHVLYTNPNGTVVRCSRQEVKRLHSITCSGCGAVYNPTEVRTCTQVHLYCPDIEHLCQY